MASAGPRGGIGLLVVDVEWTLVLPLYEDDTFAAPNPPGCLYDEDRSALGCLYDEDRSALGCLYDEDRSALGCLYDEDRSALMLETVRPGHTRRVVLVADLLNEHLKNLLANGLASIHPEHQSQIQHNRVLSVKGERKKKKRRKSTQLPGRVI